ncbi:hypothetical protein Cgig2_016210 [Carnegiea gigantea]|uniref:Chlororespiratory reduction 4 n=1 Tax=Carnegiea gigantea TaxID=171969 RepID=A0A9Q1GRI0_9CARY|nr:hypothetical protein Cgig2_020964 [Carnegiea gigantea]KAJ8424244.1 hypothetical protein Cgig2_016210 [Carnegiea gigantea]
MIIRQSSIFVVRRGWIHLYLQKFVPFYSTFAWQSPLTPHRRENGFRQSPNSEQSIVFCNSQITKMGRTGNIREAESIFNRMRVKNTVTWTALLTAYAENGELAKARKVFDEMPQRNIVSWNAMITGYVRNQLRVSDAHELFRRMPERNSVSYAAMITGYASAAMFEEAERLYNDMPRNWRDPVCANALISGYLKAGALDKAVGIFDGMMEKDVVSWSLMVDGFSETGLVDVARKLFEMIPEKNVVSWTVMINGYMKTGNFEDGCLLFLSMKQEAVRVNPRTLTSIVEACTSNQRYREGCQFHGLVSRLGFESDVILTNSIISMYGKFGCLEAANRLFQSMKGRDIVSWNSLIASYVQADKMDEAYDLFQIMPKRDIISWTTMIGGFSQKGDVAKSINLFNLMPQKDDIAWTAIISGLVNNEKFSEAIWWYSWMTQRSFRPNVLTLSSVISAASGLANLFEGLQLHSHVVKMHMEHDLSVQNSLVSMYSKCGNISDAYRVFKTISSPNVVSFNSMIMGFAYHGLGQESLNLFNRMQMDGQKPNEISFLGVLSACSHIGSVAEGQEFFKSMRSDYHIEPSSDHYACMIDLLGRAGLLDQAVDLILSMPFEPHAGAWGALLNASCSQSRPDIAKLAAEQLMILEPDNATPLVALSNMYSSLGRRDGEEVRLAQKSKGILKSAGCSWILLTNTKILRITSFQFSVFIDFTYKMIQLQGSYSIEERMRDSMNLHNHSSRSRLRL